MVPNHDLSSFGVLLKAFRVRKHLTQQQLANVIGVHRHAIGRWEQGDFLPKSKTMVLELTRHLHLNDQETRQLLEASLTALSPYWSVPLLRNPHFTGREAVLEELHLRLGAEQTVVLTQSSAIYGLGGVGKTQIALEYAYRHALEYSAVFWIRAETEALIVSSFLHVAEVLQLPEREHKGQQRAVAAVQRWFQAHSQWLLIWDNLEELPLLERFLPSTHSGAILLTTRQQALGPITHGLELLPLELDEGVLLLLLRAKVVAPGVAEEQVRQFAESTPTEYTAATDIVTSLGGLPLALDQAGAYIEETGCGLSGYLSRYQQQHAFLLKRRGNFPGYHPHSVTMTFRLSMEQVEQEYPVAADILHVCALLSADTLPEELFVEGADSLGPAFAGFSADPTRLDAALATLRRWSLIERHAHTRTLSLHRLVQTVLKEEMPKSLQSCWMTRILQALTQLFPGTDDQQAAKLQRCDRLLPHALIALNWQEYEQEQEQTRLVLMNHVATYLRLRTRFDEAEALYQRALDIGEQTPCPDQLLVAEILEGLADLHMQQARFAEAEPLYLRALQLQEHSVGSEHMQVANSLYKLAFLLDRLVRYPEAEALYRRALTIQEQVMGREHPDIATSLNGLALVLHTQGKYAEAQVLYQRALAINEHVLGKEHAVVAIVVRNQADLSRDLGTYGLARSQYKRALKIMKQVWGSKDPDIAFVLNGMAKLACMTGKDEAAEAYFRRALQLWEAGFGPEHPRVAEPLRGLATLAWKQGNAEQAEQLYQRALSLEEQHLAPQHPQLANTLYDLALFRQQQGKLDEALALANRALTIRSQVLVNEHVDTIASRTLCALLLQEQGANPSTVTREQTLKESGGRIGAEYYAKETLSTLSQKELLLAFLNDCCELHPRAWCCSSDLWQAYQGWIQKHQERFPLSRRAFAAQLKVHGYQADRTNAARIWRGIALRSPACDAT